MNKLLTNTLLAIGVTAGSASFTIAQTANPSAPAGAQSHHAARHHQDKRAFSSPSERVEARLAYIRTALKITDTQQPQWNTFADSMRKQAAERTKRMQEWRAQAGQRTERQRPNAIERLERQQKHLTAAAASLNERLAVQKPLYAALSADQKLVADELFARRGGRGMGHHRGFHRGA